MRHTNSFPEEYSQNNQLPIRIVSPNFGHLSPQAIGIYGSIHRLHYYFFLFIQDGSTQQSVDGETFDLGKQELLFLLPHQIHQVTNNLHGKDYYKLGFDEDCLGRLPKQYPFLLNPLNRQKVSFSPAAARRLQAIFDLLQGLLTVSDMDPDLILAHLNSLLTDYFSRLFKKTT